ncbi:LytTR family DNA-binding domain-containing protein [Caulobacter sp. NIBR2454]|uniref:LytTR family DNA-binding domain-containing protein n=1 Tax=Caulobacter sp. NIBR2454 TaxID=3015996 RepID=UPI0022B72F46|nr:LytTR family DNA-binding domain-containing protein [Caulobacter sp. NIBR2454]
MSGEDRRDLLIGWLIATAAVWATTTVNVFSTADDAKIDLIWPAIWEYTSAVSNMIAMLIVWAAVRWSVMRRRTGPQLLAVHAVGALAYSIPHVAIFVGLRELIYGALGRTYEFGPLTRYFYELRKDIIGYAILSGIFWGVMVLRRRSATATAASTFDIMDGSRLVRVEVADILAITAAGNYAEFILSDGRRPLMRSSLAALEEKLGFTRTHRSWLVNPTRVTGLRPDGSGDYTVELGALEAPLSRRFPEATARLRRA